MIEIVEEAPHHHAVVADLLRAAFGGGYEAELVDRLRREGLVAGALVALQDGEVVGHEMFSPLSVEVEGRPVNAVSLAPVAVRPDCQRRGIGSRLIREGIEAMRSEGRAAIIVVGHPGYYPRFGFSAALAAKLSSPFEGEAFMALELIPGALAGRSGSVGYPAAFS